MIRVSIADTGKIFVTINDDGPIRIRMVGIEPIRINAFNYPPEIDRINQQVIETKEDVLNATELANQASQAATTATESANAAGSLASQAAQAAQEAAGIAEGAATTAGEAAQAINEHAQATNNPHATNVTQEFADAQITPLALESTYTPTVWSYLVGLFTPVPKSVLQHLIKLWGVVNGLATRIGLLEDSYILKFVVPIDTSSVELDTDRYGNAFNFEEGTTLQICIRVDAFVGGQPNNINIRFNNNSNDIYAWATLKTKSFQMMGTNYNGGSCVFTFTVTNKEIDAFWASNIKNSSTSFNGQQLYKGCTTALNADMLTKITLSVVNTNYPIPAGTVIIIKKL